MLSNREGVTIVDKNIITRHNNAESHLIITNPAMETYAQTI